MVAAAATLVIGAWRIESRASSGGAAQSTGGAASNAVQLVPGGQRVAARPGHKGATFYWLEGRTVRVTTRFTNAVATAERGPDGDLTTQLVDTSGNELARFKADRIDDSTHVLQYVTPGGKTLQALGQAQLRPTLEWVNRQAFLLWNDRADTAPRLEWQQGFMRPAGAPRRDVQRDVVELRTDWADGLSATTVHRFGRRVEYQTGRVAGGEVVVGHLRQDSVEIGVGNWFPSAHVFTWSLPGRTEGFLDAERLSPVGGWVFEPDDEWMNLQLIAFAHFRRLLDEKGVVACGGGRAGALERLVRLVEPTVSANEAGCDGLHWLDGTVLRFCCDSHDFCYSKFGCSSSSWWQWWTSWQCDGCNLAVVACFTDTLYSPMQQYWW